MKKFFLVLMITFIALTSAVKISNAVELCTLEEVSLDENCNFNEVKACHILVKTKEQAEQIREQIINGRSFEAAAREYSICPSAEQGGDLGYFSRGMMVPAFEKVAFSIPIGEVSEPVETEFGWHIILVTDRR